MTGRVKNADTSRISATAVRHTAESAARAAGKLIRARAGAVAGQAKSDPYDLVSECDLEAERLIRSMIAQDHPGSQIIGEEESVTGGADGVRWYVDPIDGTNNFLRRLPLFCISIGAEIGGRLCVGVVHDPVRGETIATHGEGIYVDGEPWAGRREAGGTQILLTDLPRSGRAPDAAQLDLFARMIAHYDVRRIGSSAMALAYVAIGRADVACNAAARIWDVAAGHALLVAAGAGFEALSADGAGPGYCDGDGFVGYRTRPPDWLCRRMGGVAP